MATKKAAEPEAEPEVEIEQATRKSLPITLINTTAPFMRVVVDPIEIRTRQFAGGKLVLTDDDPDREFLLAWANGHPDVRVVTTAVWCPECGIPFVGGNAHAMLGQHRKEFHLEAWFADKQAELAEERNVILTERSGIPCPLCAPNTERFPDSASLAVHSQVIHADRSAEPALDEQGNTLGRED